MQIQVNSDRTVAVDASLTRFVRNEAARILDTVAARVTRVEVHLSDVNAGRSGPADKQCVVEARPAGARPLSTSAAARRLDAAIGQALRKMQRALRSHFGRHARAATGRAARAPRGRTTTAASAASPRTKRVGPKAPTATKATLSSSATSAASTGAKAAGKAGAAQNPKKARRKTPISQARRKA